MELLFQNIREIIRGENELPIMHTSFYTYNVFILEFHRWRGCRREIVKEYKNLRFFQLDKYAWLFRRRAALLQIENPNKLYAFKIVRQATTDENNALKLKNLKNRIRSAKAKLTQNNRKLEKAKKEWSSLFPIEEDATYIRTIEYLRNKEFSLNSMQSELKELL